jgi:hypothetical protein
VTTSRKANRYGSLAERKAAEEYDLRREGAHTSWCDAVDSEGVPHEIKAAMLNRRSGGTGRFRVFEEYHEQLAAAGGRYVFVAYKRAGRGIRVVEMKRLSATKLPVSTWYGAGGHRESRQTKISPSAFFCDI